MEVPFLGGLWSRNYHTDLTAAGIARLRLFESKGKDIAVRGSIPESEPAHIQLTTGGDWLLATDYQGRNQTLQEVGTFRLTAMPLPIFLEGEGFKELTILFTPCWRNFDTWRHSHYFRAAARADRLEAAVQTTDGSPQASPAWLRNKDPEADSSRQTRYQPVGRSEGKPAGQLAKNSSALPNEGCFDSPKKGIMCGAKDSSALQNEGWAQGGLQHLQTSPPLARGRHCQARPRAQARTLAQAAQLRQRFGTRCDEFGCRRFAPAGATRNRSYHTQIIGL